MKPFSLGDAAAAAAAAGAYYATKALFVRSLAPLPETPFAVAAALAVFCGVKGGAAILRAAKVSSKQPASGQARPETRRESWPEAVRREVS